MTELMLSVSIYFIEVFCFVHFEGVRIEEFSRSLRVLFGQLNESITPNLGSTFLGRVYFLPKLEKL